MICEEKHQPTYSVTTLVDSYSGRSRDRKIYENFSCQPSTWSFRAAQLLFWTCCIMYQNACQDLLSLRLPLNKRNWILCNGFPIKVATSNLHFPINVNSNHASGSRSSSRLRDPCMALPAAAVLQWQGGTDECGVPQGTGASKCIKYVHVAHIRYSSRVLSSIDQGGPTLKLYQIASRHALAAIFRIPNDWRWITLDNQWIILDNQPWSSGPLSTITWRTRESKRCRGTCTCPRSFSGIVRSSPARGKTSGDGNQSGPKIMGFTWLVTRCY